FVYARRLNSPEAEARALGGLADAAYAQGRMRSAFEHFSRCVSLSREHGFGKIEVANRSMIGFSRIYLMRRSKRGRMVMRPPALPSSSGNHVLNCLAKIWACSPPMNLATSSPWRAISRAQ